MNRYFAEVRAMIERHGGIVDKFIGDAVMAVFGIPRVREDDALRALRAAVEIRDRLPGIAEEVGVALQFRIGINTGLVLAGGAGNVATGDSVNLAARLQRSASPGEILLGSETLRLVRGAVVVEPLQPLARTDRSGSVPAFRLLGLDPLAPGFARRFDVPLVGRQRELSLLREAWIRAVGGSGCHLFTVLGEAGVGKSRLVAELLAGVGDATAVLRGRCLHYGEGITFWPLIEALTALGGEAQPVLELLDSGSVSTPEELFLEVRRLLESLALERPVIVHVDDLQWAEPTLLDLLDHVVDLSRGAPILVLCAARLELLEHRPGWGGGKLNATTALLEPLGASDCETLIDQLADDLDPDARARVIGASEGNPLFLQEMVGLIRERGTVAVPATIQALLAERLERLASEERAILECGAVEGEVFHRRAVLALAGEPAASKLDSLLSILVRKELIRSHPAMLKADEAFRFRHLLIRDAAYDALPKATRAELHQRFAGWLEDSADGVVELDEIAGWHLEQAVRYRHELDRELDTTVSRRAAAHLHAAGRRASERSDIAAARNLYERALKLAPAGEPLHARIGVDLAEQLIEDGDLARADELLSAAERDPDASALAALARFEWLIRVRPHEATQTIDAKLPGILRQLVEAGDQRGIAKAHLAAYWVHHLASRHEPAGEQARLAAEHAAKAGDEGLRSQALGWYVGSILRGPQHTRAAVQALEEIAREQHGPYLATRLDFRRGQLARLEGHINASRRLIQSAIDGFHALGMPQHVAGCENDLAVTELAAGDPDAALAALQRSDEILAERGERSYRGATQALLAQTHELIGNHQAALAALDLVDELDGPEDVLGHATTHPVRAQLALAAGDSDAAERWAHSAVEHALLTDNVVLQADTRLDLARVLSAIGQRQEATSVARAALDLFLAKGDVPGTEKTRALLQELAGPA
jgi:tetratricopeptide (TPR) repeat protein